jgi:hypothetical protein
MNRVEEILNQLSEEERQKVISILDEYQQTG